MPTTVLGFFLLVVLAVPGYMYQRGRQRNTPEHVDSPFQEVLSIVFVGSVLDAAVLSLLGAAASQGLWLRVDIRALLDDPHRYAVAHVGFVAGWLTTAPLLASVLGYVSGAGLWRRFVPAGWRRRLDLRERKLDPNQSAWWLLFREHPDSQVYIGCLLDNGSYVAGILHSYSRSASEHQDRELTLRGDIVYRAPGDDDSAVLPNVSAAVLSARHMTLLTVSYLEPPTAAPPDPGMAACAGAGVPASAATAAEPTGTGA